MWTSNRSTAWPSGSSSWSIRRLDLTLSGPAAFQDVARCLDRRAVLRDPSTLTLGVATDGSAATCALVRCLPPLSLFLVGGLPLRPPAGVVDEPDEPDDPDTEFVFGLERVLDGVEALVRARR